MTDTHSAQCLEGGFQYVPWSRSLHNIIKQFKLVLLMQALRGGGGSLPSFPSLPTTPPACALSALHPPHSSVSLLSICGLIRRGEKKSFLKCHARACQEESVYCTALCFRWPANLSDIFHRENGAAVMAEWIHRLRDPFHLIIAPFELFNTNAELLVVVGGGRL